MAEGEPGKQFFILVSGTVEVLSTRKGRLEQVATLGEGDVFGEISMLSGAPRTATVRATSNDVRVLVADRGAFRELTEKHPAVHFGLTQLARERGNDEV